MEICNVDWNNVARTEYFGIIGKRIEGKDELKEKGFVVMDLDDFWILDGMKTNRFLITSLQD
ncbi:MAG: hypothetical protein U9N36_09275 [Euryarchaeota archaeon]|nr:hypothetical protein [Euryarchaeota archaeon]